MLLKKMSMSEKVEYLVELPLEQGKIGIAIDELDDVGNELMDAMRAVGVIRTAIQAECDHPEMESASNAQDRCVVCGKQQAKS